MHSVPILFALFLLTPAAGLQLAVDPTEPMQPQESRGLARSDPSEARDGFVFRCPEAPRNQDVQVRPPDTRVVWGCPIRVEDGDDSFGNLRLAVHPNDPQELAFFSLHGHPQEGGNTERSRDRQGQTHTTFTSWNAGASWSDNPILTRFGDWGEGATGTIDAAGNLYIGYLWSSHGQTSQLRFYKAATVQEDVSPAYYDPWAPSGQGTRDGFWTDRVDMVRIDVGVPAEQNRTQEPRMGGAAVPTPPTDERILATWATFEPESDRYEEPGQIRAAWTHTGTQNQWEELPEEERIGPCINASAPVVWRDRAYVACSVGSGYDHRSRARIGDIDLWSIDLLNATTRLVAHTGIRGETPVLAVDAKGYMVAMALTHQGKQAPEVRVAVGWYGEHWNPSNADFGPRLHELAGGRPVLETYISGIQVTTREKTIFIIYSEWNEPRPVEEQETTRQNNAGGDDINKVLVAFNECMFPLAASKMQLGMGVGGFSYNVSTGALDAPGPRHGGSPGAFMDLHDGFVRSVDRDGEELIHFAINDYGIVQYGAIVASATGSACDPGGPPPPPPLPAAIPQALGLANTNSVLVGSSIGLLSSIMIGYLLTVKRRQAHYTTVEDR